MKSRPIALILIAAACLLFPACKKNNDQPAFVRGNLHIDAFLLKQSDNGFLFATDTVGVVGNDTITVTLPGFNNPGYINLTPTISFTGDSIFPASGKPQNFVNPVTYKVFDKYGNYRTYIVQVILTSKNELLVDGQRVFALDLGTGVVRWIAEDGWSISPVSSAAVGNGMVYSGGGNGMLYASDAATGKTMFAQPLGNTFLYSPVVSNGIVYAASGNGNLYAVDGKTGAPKWTRTFNSYGAFTTPIIINNVVYIQCNQGFYALNALTGDSIWASKITASFYASAAIGDNLAYVSGADSNLYAIDRASGNVSWTYFIGAIGMSPNVTGGVVYVGAGNDSLFAIDAMTGVKKWSVFVDTGPSNPYISYPGIQSNPVVYNGVVFIGGGDPNLYAFNIETGALKWTTTLGNQCRGGITCANGVLYTNSGGIYAVDASSGQIKWQQSGIPAALTPCIIASDGTVYNPLN